MGFDHNKENYHHTDPLSDMDGWELSEFVQEQNTPISKLRI